MFRPALALLLSSALLVPGCVIHDHGHGHGGRGHVHVHTEFCVAYVEHYGCSHDDIVWLESRGMDWCDIGVALHIWNGCGRRVALVDIHRWHFVERVSWQVCFTRARVDVHGLFVAVDFDPGPPYGRAYGFHRNRAASFELHDDEMAALFHVRFSHDYYKLSPRDAFARGRTHDGFREMAKTEHARQGRPRWEQTEHGRREVKEREAREREAKERESKDREARERQAKEREAKERESRERQAKEREAKERREETDRGRPSDEARGRKEREDRGGAAGGGKKEGGGPPASGGKKEEGGARGGGKGNDKKK
jgi:hypothetical protein